MIPKPRYAGDEKMDFTDWIIIAAMAAIVVVGFMVLGGVK